MIQFTNTDKRWLEVIFYFFCRKVFGINQKQSDVISFIEGYRWTNMFDCDILIDIVNKEKILIDQNFAPTKQEFLALMNDPDCRLRMQKSGVIELVRDTEYRYDRVTVFHALMKEEVNRTIFNPKLTTPNVHKAIYSFLLALRYVATLVTKIKF